MLPSAIYDPCTHATPSQRLEAAARRERLERFEKSAKAIARVHEVVEVPVDKTQRFGPPINPEPPAIPEPDAVEQWVDRQKKIYKTPWFSIVEEIDTDGKKIISITAIQRAVCKHFSISRIALLSARRTTDIVRPRQVAMYLCKNLTPKSLPEIGRRFGDKDHTTVIHAVRRVVALMEINAGTKEAVAILKLHLGAT